MLDDLDPHGLEQLRRSLVMLRHDQPAGLTQARALRLIHELQRLQRSDRRHAELVMQLRALLDDLGPEVSG